MQRKQRQTRIHEQPQAAQAPQTLTVPAQGGVQTLVLGSVFTRRYSFSERLSSSARTRMSLFSTSGPGCACRREHDASTMKRSQRCNRANRNRAARTTTIGRQTGATSAMHGHGERQDSSQDDQQDNEAFDRHVRACTTQHGQDSPVKYRVAQGYRSNAMKRMSMRRCQRLPADPEPSF